MNAFTKNAILTLLVMGFVFAVGGPGLIALLVMPYVGTQLASVIGILAIVVLTAILLIVDYFHAKKSEAAVTKTQG